MEWEETVHAGTGMLGLTTRHIHFARRRKRFRVRCDRIVAFVDPYDDGFGIMRDAQTAKPHTFVIGDDWFAHNLARLGWQTRVSARPKHEPTLHKNALEQKCRVDRLYSNSSREPLNDRSNHNPRCREQ